MSRIRSSRLLRRRKIAAVSDTDRLASLMDEIVGLLRAHGEESWAEWVEYDAGLIRSRDARGAEHFLAAFGSAGSLSDLIFHPFNGNAASEAEGRADTERLQELLFEAQPLAQDLSRELDAAYVPEEVAPSSGPDEPEEPEEPRPSLDFY